MTTYTMTMTDDATAILAEANTIAVVSEIIFDALVDFNPIHDAYGATADAIAVSIVERLKRS